MSHPEVFEHAGKTATILSMDVTIKIVDWWEREPTKPLREHNQPWCLAYRDRAKLLRLPDDGQVVYGTVNGLPTLAHVSELEFDDAPPGENRAYRSS